MSSLKFQHFLKVECLHVKPQWSYKSLLCAQSPMGSLVKAVLKVSCLQESIAK